MAGVSDAFDVLDPLDRGYALVGRFLQEWAFVENQLRGAIAKALGLTTIQSVWVCANITFRNKVNILKTAIDVTRVRPTSDRIAFKKQLDTIASHSATRNMIAHEMFTVSDDGSVDFFVVKAKGKFDLPKTIWKKTDFEKEYVLLEQYAQQVKTMGARLGGGATSNALAKALLSSQATSGAPMGGLFGLDPANLPTLPPEAPPHSNPAPSSEETESQTPPEPQD